MTSVYWVKAFALILVLAVFAHANCAVSCVHPHNGKVPAPDSAPQSPENCHQSKAPAKSHENEDGAACAHSQVSGDRPPISGQYFKPIPAVMAGPILSLSSKLARIPVVVEFYSPNSYASAPLIAILRI